MLIGNPANLSRDAELSVGALLARCDSGPRLVRSRLPGFDVRLRQGLIDRHPGNM